MAAHADGATFAVVGGWSANVANEDSIVLKWGPLAPPAVIAGTTNGATGVVNNTATTTTAAALAGSTILVACYNWDAANATALATVTDSAGNVYTHVQDVPATASVFGCSLYRSDNVTALPSGGTITVNLNSGQHYAVNAWAITGVRGGVDVTPTPVTTASGTSLTCASGALATSAEILIGVCEGSGNFNTLVEGNGFKSLLGSGVVAGSGIDMAYLLASSAASASYNPNSVTTQALGGFVISLQAPGWSMSHMDEQAPPLFINWAGVGGWVESDVQVDQTGALWTGVGGWIESDVQIDQTGASWAGVGSWSMSHMDEQAPPLFANWAGVGSFNGQDFEIQADISANWAGVGSFNGQDFEIQADISALWTGVGSFNGQDFEIQADISATWTGVGGWTPPVLTEVIYLLGPSPIFTQNISVANIGWGTYSQRIICQPLASGGTQIAVTFNAAPGAFDANFDVNHVSIGKQNTTYNTVSTPVELLFGGASGFNIAHGTTITSDQLSFTVAATDTLIVIIDHAATSSEMSNSAGGTGDSFYQIATASYNVASPTGTWTEYSTAVAISQIQIFPAPPALGYAGVGSWSLNVTEVPGSTGIFLNWNGVGGWIESDVQVDQTGALWTGVGSFNGQDFEIQADISAVWTGVGGWIESDVQVDQTGALWTGAGSWSVNVLEQPPQGIHTLYATWTGVGGWIESDVQVDQISTEFDGVGGLLNLTAGLLYFYTSEFDGVGSWRINVIKPQILSARNSAGSFVILDATAGQVVESLLQVNMTTPLIFNVGFPIPANFTFTITAPDGSSYQPSDDFYAVGQQNFQPLGLTSSPYIQAGQYVFYTFTQNELAQSGPWSITVTTAATSVSMTFMVKQLARAA